MLNNCYSPDKINIIAVKIYSNSGKYNTPLSKQNYALWYDYFEGKTIGLQAAMDELMKSDQAIPPSAMKQLFHQYVDQDQKKIMTKVQAQTQKIIKDVLQGVLDIGHSSSAYEQNLEKHIKGLSNIDSIDQVQDIIAGILKDTKKMSDANQHLQKKFEKAKSQSEILSQKLEQTEQAASTDALTGLYNRRVFDKVISRMVESYKKRGKTFSIVMLDIDHFKHFNDTYGHQMGDEVLKNVGTIIKKGIKGGDIPTRYGGEEFVIILPNTSLTKARIVAEQLRIRIAIFPLKVSAPDKEVEKVTVSLGISEINEKDDVLSVVGRADKALYLAKDSGRNNIKSEKEL